MPNFRFHDAVLPLLEPIEHVHAHPQNVNNGDVEAIVESIQVNGYTLPVLAQRSTGDIIAGNHRYYALLDLGSPTIPVLWVNMEDDEALRYMLADNRTTRLGRDDLGLLEQALAHLQNDTQLRLVGTGFDDNYLSSLTASLSQGLNLGEQSADDGFAKQRSNRAITCPACGHEFGAGR